MLYDLVLIPMISRIEERRGTSFEVGLSKLQCVDAVLELLVNGTMHTMSTMHTSHTL